jgi:hypothetical protein
MRFAFFWVVTKRRVVIPYRRFRIVYQSHFQESRNPKSKQKSWTSWSLKMGRRSCPETSVRNYHSTLCNIPEERRSQTLLTRMSNGQSGLLGMTTTLIELIMNSCDSDRCKSKSIDTIIARDCIRHTEIWFYSKKFQGAWTCRYYVVFLKDSPRTGERLRSVRQFYVSLIMCLVLYHSKQVVVI